jgi:hypothetical protein
MVRTYALIRLIIRCNGSSNWTKHYSTSIASQSQCDRPNNPAKPNQFPTKPDPSSIPTNHVRVHAAHDHEHDCHDSFFTILTSYTFPMSCNYPFQSFTYCMKDVSLHTSRVCTSKSLQGISMVSSTLCIPMAVSPPV